MRHVSFERNAIESLIKDSRNRFELRAARLYLIDGVAADFIGLTESFVFPHRVAGLALVPVDGTRVRELPLAPQPCDGAVLFRPASPEEVEGANPRRDRGFFCGLAIEELEIVASDDASVSFRRTGKVQFI